MKALVKYQNGNGFVELREVPEPQLENDHSVKIQVEYCGVCGSDVHIWDGMHQLNCPVILGHELSGTVVDVGSAVTNVKVGDRVVSETPKTICGNCFYCNSGQTLMCKERKSIGSGTDGAYAKYLVIRDAIVHKIPSNVSFEEATLCEVGANAVHACCDRTNVLPGDNVVVLGPGPIGLLCAQVAKARGANVILVGTDADAYRFDIAAKVGITNIVNCQKQDLAEYVMKFTDGNGADKVLECCGVLKSIDNAFSIIRNGGVIVQVGLTHERMDVLYSKLAMNEISVVGSYGHNWSCWDRFLRLISLGKVNTKDMATHIFPLDEWEQGFTIAKNAKGMKVLIKP